MRATQILSIVGALGAVALAIPLFAGADHGGLRTSEYSDGSPRERVAWVDGEREGHCVRWNRDGSIAAEGDYRSGKQVGHWNYYLQDGQPDTARSGEYVNGRRTR